MLEVLIVLGGVGALAGLALLVIFVPPMALALGSLGLMVLGLVLGVPTGIYYHVLLRRELLRDGGLPNGWYWRPHEHHAQLADEALARVRPWFFMGAAGFLLIVVGFAIAVVALFVGGR